MARTSGRASSSARVAQVQPCAFASCSSRSKFGTIKADTQGRRSPISTASVTQRLALSFPSSGCGATFLPPAVTSRSLRRSVMTRYPSASKRPMSPVWNQPSRSACAVAASFLK